MSEVMERIGTGTLERLHAAVRMVADIPELADLPPDVLEKVTGAAIAQELTDRLREKAAVERIDYENERGKYLATVSPSGSKQTRRSYARALELLESWCEEHGATVPALTPMLVDDWIASLRAEGRAPRSVRVISAACSGFMTWLERRHTEVRNPFRGTRALPKAKSTRSFAVPSPEEVYEIIEASPEPLRAAVVTMAELGVRVGALPSLSVNGNRYTAHSKAKDIAGPIPESVRAALAAAKLSLREPFAGMTAGAIADRFRRVVKELYTARKLRAEYSPHDLRHAFAVKLYRETKDVVAVSRALNHSGIAITQTYLRAIGEEA